MVFDKGGTICTDLSFFESSQHRMHPVVMGERSVAEHTIYSGLLPQRVGQYNQTFNRDLEANCTCRWSINALSRLSYVLANTTTARKCSGNAIVCSRKYVTLALGKIVVWNVIVTDSLAMAVAFISDNFRRLTR
jgi:hypothetical protein